MILDLRRFHTARAARRVVGSAGVLVAIALASVAGATVASITPSYVPPRELLQFLGARTDGTGFVASMAPGHDVRVLVQDTANLLVVQGDAADVQAIQDLARAADVAPHQIVLDAQIVQIDEDKARAGGLLWNTSLGSVTSQADYFTRSQWDASTGSNKTPKQTTTRKLLGFDADLGWGASIRLAESKGWAHTRTVPRVVTLNNRRATILDGARVVYLARFASYNSLFQTDSLDAGVTLSVLPSLGAGGTLRLAVRAEMCALSSLQGGGLSKVGQMIENEVVTRDGQPVLLGGFDRTSDSKSEVSVPGLGHILPFLFSHRSKSHSSWKTYLVLTPHVVDMAATVDGSMQGDQK